MSEEKQVAPQAQANEGSEDVPRWILDLVPIAEHARGMLVRSLPPLLLGLLMSFVFLRQDGWSHWMPLIIAILLGMELVLKNRAVYLARHASRPLPVLRPGGRTGAILVVADILGTAFGLGVWVLAALVDAPRELWTGTMACAVFLMSAYVTVLMCEWLEPRTRWAQVIVSLMLFPLWLGTLAAAMWQETAGFNWGIGQWWWLVILALVCDVLAFLAFRVGRRNDLARGDA